MSSEKKSVSTIASIGIWILLGCAWSVVALQFPLFEENQNTKFLHAAAYTRYGFLEHDWMAQTLDPLPAFTFIVETLFRINSLWVVYLLFPLLLALLLYSLTSIVDRIYGFRKDITAFIFFLGILFLEEKNLQLGFGTQYLIGHYLQPCVFGVLIIVAIDRFLANARFQPSLFLALAAAIHPAYMPSALLIQSSFTLITLYKEKRLTFSALLPLLLFAALSAPLLIRYKLLFAYTSPQIGAEAMEILASQRLSYHAQVKGWINYEDYIGMALIALSMVMIRKSLLFWIMVPLAALIAVSVPLLYFVPLPSIEVLTPWRTSVILLPLAYAVLAGWAASRLIPFMQKQRVLQIVLLIAGCAAITIPVVRHLPLQIALFRHQQETAEAAVMRFARTHSTEKDIWLIPTRNGRFDSFRLTTGLPILINWKTHPYKDREILQWYKRNKDAEMFYERANTPSGLQLLHQLGAKYGITYAIVPSNIPSSLYGNMRFCWKDKHYAVIALSVSAIK